MLLLHRGPSYAGSTSAIGTTLLVLGQVAVASYCSNGAPVRLTGKQGTITDGSPPFQHSRAGSDCVWFIIPSVNSSNFETVTTNFTIEFTHWELNPFSVLDNVEVSLITSKSASSFVSEKTLGNVFGFLENPIYASVSNLSNVATTSFLTAATKTELLNQRRRFSVPNMIPTYQIIKVRFTTDSAGPQFDGFSARWWTSEAENRSSSSACPNNCYSDFGRGACSEDGICACLSGYSGVDCHNDDQWKLQTFFSMCNGSSWISSQNWLSGSQPCNQTAANARNISLNWVGVGGCVAQRVTTLALPANNVCCSSGNATFPSYLRSIDLSDNHLSKFPKFVSNLPQLTALELGGNGMSGPVPASFFSNSELGLISLNLSCNNLSGRFDSSPWIPGLLSLDLHQNSFEGWVPDSLGSMAVPGSVYLQNNSFLCPATNYASVNNYSCVNFSLDSVSPSHILMPISAVVPSKLFLLDLSYIPQSIPFTCLIDGLTPVPASIYNSTTIMCSIPPISPGAHSISISIDPSRESSVNFVPLSSLSFIVTTSCPPGSHLIQDAFSDHCATCPAGAACRGGTAVPESAPGYFESPQNALVFLDCFNTAYCLGNNTCSAEAMGERCAFCADGFVNVNGNCVVCQPGQSLGVAIGFVIAGLGLPVWWIWRAWMGDGNAAYGILIMYFQIIGLFDKYPINWDSMLGDIVKAVSIAILNTDYINLQCAYGLGFYERMFFVWTIPFMIGAIFKLVVLLKSMWLSRCTGFSFTKHMAEWDHYAIQGFCSFLMLLHVPLTDRAFRQFTCVIDPYDNRYYISGNSEISCYDQLWTFGASFAAVFAILYGFGIPVAFLYVLFRNRTRLTEPSVVHRYGILFNSYTQDAWYWTPFQMFWSLCFMMLPAIFRKRPSYLMFISVCMMYIYIFALVYAKPFRLKRNNHVAILSWITIVIFLFAGIVVGFLQTGETATDDNRWIMKSVVTLFYVSLVITVHAFLFEVVKNSDDSLLKGKGGKLALYLYRVPLVGNLFLGALSRDVGKLELDPDHDRDIVIVKTTGAPNNEILNPIVAVPVDAATVGVDEVTVEPHNFNNQIKNSHFALSWVVDGGELKDLNESGTGFNHIVSRSVADAKQLISDVANTISGGMRGTHVQLKDEDEGQESAMADQPPFSVE